MDTELGRQLIASLREAIEYLEGRKTPVRVTIRETTSKHYPV